MSRDRQYVQDMIDSAQQIVAYLDGYTVEQFERDTLRQDCDRVVTRRIWNTATNDLPSLVTQLQAILDEKNGDDTE